CFDIIAPIKSKVTSLTRSAPWYTDQLRHLKRHGRQLARLAKKTGLTVHLDAFKLHQQQYIDALNTARSSHYSSIIQSGPNDPKTLFSTINKLLKPMDTISTSFTTGKRQNRRNSQPAGCPLPLHYQPPQTSTHPPPHPTPLHPT